jgi:SPFH domain / Band 7 family
VIDTQTEPWGIKVTTVEIKDVEIPERMQHAIARQAEAERERRAKIINAEGEAQAATRLKDAANVIGANPVTLQLRYLQTLREIGANSSTIVFPMPIDLMRPLLEAIGNPPSDSAAQTDPEREHELEEGVRQALDAGSDGVPGTEAVTQGASEPAARPDPETTPER